MTDIQMLDTSKDPWLEKFSVDVPEMTSLTSIAISLKRIADALEQTNDYGETGWKALARVIRDT